MQQQIASKGAGRAEARTGLWQRFRSRSYDAAAIDGASRWQSFWSITLPLLAPTTFFLLVTGVIGSFQVFSPVYVITKGGPLDSTDVVVFRIYQRAFSEFKMGYGSAQAWVGTWTDLLWPLLIAREQNLRTLELGLAYFNARTTAFQQPNWPLMMAGAVVVMAPVLLVYLFTQRYFVAGIALSGLKG